MPSVRLDAKELIPIVSRHLSASSEATLDESLIETVVEIFLSASAITGDVEEDAAAIMSAIEALPDAADAMEDLESVSELIASDARQRLLKLQDKRAASGLAWFMTNMELAEGMRVMAVLDEDGEFHTAVVKAVASVSADVIGTATTEQTVTVAFDEFGGMERVVTPSSVLVLSDENTAGETTEGTCEMCHRDTKVTDHHLIPRSEHSRFVKRGYKMSFLKGRENIAEICRPCHNTVHRFASNKELADKYETTEKLLAEEPIQKWVEWVSTQSHGKHRKDHKQA